MAWRPKVKGIQIPDRYLRNDIDDSIAGQLTVNKSLRLSGAGAKIYLANAGGTVGTLSIGAGNAVIFQIGATTGTIIDV